MSETVSVTEKFDELTAAMRTYALSGAPGAFAKVGKMMEKVTKLQDEWVNGKPEGARRGRKPKDAVAE